MARRSLAPSSHAVLEEPTQPELEPQLAGRDPVAARRHQPGGEGPRPERQMAAVQDRPRRHRGLPLTGRALCSTRGPRRLSSQARSWPQAGQRKPSGQRFATSRRAHASSSANRASNSGSDRGRPSIPAPPSPARAILCPPRPMGRQLSTGQATSSILPPELLFASQPQARALSPPERNQIVLLHRIARDVRSDSKRILFRNLGQIF